MDTVNKKFCTKYKVLSTLLNFVENFMKNATTCISVSLSAKGFDWLVKPISFRVACGLTMNNKVKFEIVMRKYKKHQNLPRKCNCVSSFLTSFKGRKCLQDNTIDKK